MTLAVNFHTSTAGVVDAPRVSTTPVASLSPVSTSLAVNFPTGTAGVVDTSVKFTTGVYDTGRKFATWSTTPVANNGTNIRLLTPEVKLK
jgi:hypothetical protein